MDDQGKTMKSVFTVVERQGKSYWTRIGAGFVNRDGSMNLVLDAIPTSGKIQVREWEPPPERRDGTGGVEGGLSRARPRGQGDLSTPPFGGSARAASGSPAAPYEPLV